MGPQVGFTLEDVSARSMQAGGALALLMARVNTDTIRLVGRWRSDVVILALRAVDQAAPLKTAARCVSGVANLDTLRSEERRVQVTA